MSLFFTMFQLPPSLKLINVTHDVETNNWNTKWKYKVACPITFLMFLKFPHPWNPCSCSQVIMVRQTKPVKAASHLPSRTSSPLLWRTSKSQMSSMKTQLTTLHQKPQPLLQQCLLLLCCQVRSDWKSFFCLSATSWFGTAALCAMPGRNLSS